MSITQNELKELLHYDPETGVFTWKVDRGSRYKAGSRAGSVGSYGYREIRLSNKLYKEHRLVWLYVYGVWPEFELDHINGVTGDNRLCNLREATSLENKQNASIRSDNTSGHTGVCWHKRARKWMAYIAVNNKIKYLGLHKTIDEAKEAYLKAKEELHTFNPTVR